MKKSVPKKAPANLTVARDTTKHPIQPSSIADAVSAAISLPNNNGNIDIDALSIPTNYGERFAVTKVLSNIPVRKPHKSAFIRVKQGDEFLIYILEDKLSGVTYAVMPQVAQLVPESARAVRLHRAVDRQGNQLLVPVPLPGEDGKRNVWHESLMVCLAKAEHKWVRVAANLSAGAYDLYVAQGELGEPEWTDHTMRELVEIAFRGKVISEEKDPVIQQLLGRI